MEPLTQVHWLWIRAIYLEGIATGNATFQQTASEWSDWDEAHLQVATHRGVR